jgi:alpha-tubulin suppressor-like RCC1 family protein
LDPATSSVVPTPQTISGFTNVLQVSGGVNHSCMVLKTGQVLCWGANDSGQLGGGPGDAAFSPKLVDWATNVASVFAGATFTCACLKSGEVQCWGLLPGALSSTQLLLSPTSVPGLANTTSLVQIDTKICGVTPTGTISCVESETSSATQIAGLADVKMLSAAGHACALVKGGTVKCWGSNLYGQLGDETTNDSDTPVTAKGP